jgi:hypothetical protein
MQYDRGSRVAINGKGREYRNMTLRKDENVLWSMLRKKEAVSLGFAADKVFGAATI